MFKTELTEFVKIEKFNIMINFKDVIGENTQDHNQGHNFQYIAGHPYRIQ